METICRNQEQFLKITKQIISANRVSHAYLIEVDNYEENMYFVLKFIKRILCLKYSADLDLENCNLCNTCSLIDSNHYPDLKIIQPDGQWIKKNQLLDLQSEYQNKSLLNGKRIYLIQEADKLNLSAANTMLKFLEEPEEDIIAFLLTKNRYQVLETILSRCQILSLKGSIESFSSFSPEICLFLEILEKKSELFIQYTTILETIFPDKTLGKERLQELETFFISFLNQSLKEKNHNLKSIEAILNRIGKQQIIKYIAIIEEEIPKLEYNVNYKLWLDALFARMIGGRYE